MRREAVFNKAELAELLRHDEGQFLEFKSLWERSGPNPRPLDRRKVRDLIAEYVAAFANSDGGTLLLGVEDDGIPTGHAYPEKAIEEFFSVPLRRLRPSTECRTQRTAIRNQEILIFEVSRSEEAVMIEGGGFPYRVGDHVIFEPESVINERKQTYRRVGFEQRVRPGAAIEDVDLALAKDFFDLTPFRDRETETLLARYGLVHYRAGSPAITNACLLLFAKPPLTRWHPRAGIRFFRVSGKERLHGSVRNVTQIGRIDSPLAIAIREAHAFAREQIRRSEKLHDLFFKEMPEYPEFAWQECIINAFAHRDYEDQTREIEVHFFEDRMEVSSPGVPVPPVTVDMLRERKPVHASRNPLIVRVLADARLMREEGEGIPRMFEEMEASFLHPPVIEVDAGAFRLALRNDPIFSGPSDEWTAMVQAMPISQAQKRVLLARPGGFTNEDYRKFNMVDRDHAYREIQELVSQGIVMPAEAPGRGAVYRVSPNVREARAFLQSRLPRLNELLQARGSVSNADYRELFEVTRLRATRELNRLVEEGYLVLKGKGRGARYVGAHGASAAQGAPSRNESKNESRPTHHSKRK